MEPVVNYPSVKSIDRLIVLATVIASGMIAVLLTSDSGPGGAAAQVFRHERLTVAQIQQRKAALYRVRDGDTLSSISAKIYGNAATWPVLWWDNRHKVPNPNVLAKGEKLSHGRWNYVRPWLQKRAMAALPQVIAQPASGGVSDPAPAPAPAAPAAAAAPLGSFEACVIARESGGNPAAVNPLSGAGGLFQFLPSTWASMPWGAQYPGGAQTAPVSVQYAAFSWLYARAGSSPWASDGC